MRSPLLLFRIMVVVARSLPPFQNNRRSLTARDYCSNPQEGNGCNMAGNAPCCVDDTTIASCIADRSITGVSDTNGNWQIQSCQLECYIDSGGVGHCPSVSGCDCNDSCCVDWACQASQEYCGLNGDCECDGPYAKKR